MPRTHCQKLLAAARQLQTRLDRLRFSPPVHYVYAPLDYAWTPHAAYLNRFGAGPKKVVFLGMNPGPFGMVQTGIPFGEVAAVRDWMGIEAPVGKPPREHPKRPVLGFACPRSEVSGRRLWGLFAERFPRAEDFFAAHFVANYCPLAFLEESGANRTPDKLPAGEQTPLLAACDRHLAQVVAILEPRWVIGVGGFALARAQAVLGTQSIQLGSIPHPSPANPAANRDWAGAATRALEALGVWS